MISRLRVEPPVLTCSRSVTVSGFIPNARIRIYVDLTLVSDAILPDPDLGVIDVPDLKKDQMVTATQEFDGKESAQSAPEKVVDYREVFPSGLPSPGFPYLYLYNCGIATVVDQLPPGGTVRVYSRAPGGVVPGGMIANVDGVGALQGMLVAPPFQTNHKVTAQSQICPDLSPLSEEQVVMPAPSVLPTPEVTGIYEGGSILTVHQLVNGAKITIKNGGTTIVQGGAPASHVKFILATPVIDKDVLEITQELCGIISPPVTVIVQPCSALPPPKVMAPRPGDDVIYPTKYEPGSRLRIFAGGIEIGDGGGSSIRLMRPLLANETIVVVQTLGNCTASTSFLVEVGKGLEDPLLSGDCGKVLAFEYGAEDDPLRQTTDIRPYFNYTPVFNKIIPMDSVPLHAVVRYPEGPGPFPIVLIVHGNVDPAIPSHRGYVYLLELLAKHCMIGVSVDETFLNGPLAGGETDARGIVLLRHLQLWREWNRTPGNRFYGKVDMNRVGLAGHSRGGEGILAADVLNRNVHNPADSLHDFNFNIRALCALAPPDDGFELSPVTLRGGADYYIMHGSHDADISDFIGHRAYDRAFPVTGAANNFKGLLFIYGGNHNMFNTELPTVDLAQLGPLSDFVSNTDQQQFTKLYMSSFFLASLKGWKSYRYFLNGEVTFGSVPSSTKVFQYQDPQRIFLNHYEEDDDLATGSYPGVTNTSQGPLEIYVDHDFWEPGPKNFLFEETDGLIAAWRDRENAAVRIQLPVSLQTSNPNEFFAFRVGQSFEDPVLLNTANANKDMSVQLAFVTGMGPELKVSDYATLPYPKVVGLGFSGGGTKTIMQTVRIPWKDLIGNVPYAPKVKEIVLKFNRHNRGKVVIDEIQFTE